MYRAKYIEGLENRLGRMESLLRLSGRFLDSVGRCSIAYLSYSMNLTQPGLLNEDDNGRTDLGTLEKRLAENKQRSQSHKSPSTAASNPTSPSHSSPNEANEYTPRSTAPDSPPSKSGISNRGKNKSCDEPAKSEECVEDLSDMMCSLVTNNCGETRYIGIDFRLDVFDMMLTAGRIFFWLLNFLTQRHTVG